MNFDELRAELRKGIENAPLDDGMRVDLAMILLKGVSELQKLNKTLSEIEAAHRPEWMSMSDHREPHIRPLTLPKE